MVIAMAVMMVGYGSCVIFEWLLEIAREGDGEGEDRGEIRARQVSGKRKLTGEMKSFPGTRASKEREEKAP